MQEEPFMGLKTLLLIFLTIENYNRNYNKSLMLFILCSHEYWYKIAKTQDYVNKIRIYSIYKYLRMVKRMLLLVLIWILKWLKFSCNSFDLNRSPGVHSGRLVHGRWSDNTLQCNHWWAFSRVGVSATELWRLWQTPSGLADRSIRPFQGTGILVCTCESWVKFILSTWKTIRNIIIYRWLANDQSS